MPAAEFRLRAYRKPVPYFLFVVVVAACCFLVFGIGVAATVGKLASLVAAIVVSLAALAFMLWKDHRAQPAGVLRLSEGKLEYTASVLGPIAFTPGDVRDMVEQEGLFVLRLKRGAALIIEPSRLEVALSELRTALAAWMLTTNDGVEFVNQTAQAQKNENRRVQIMAWAGGIAILARVILAILKD